jgi:hypothetical protein
MEERGRRARIDRALLADARRLLRSGPFLAALGVLALAAVVQVLRAGPERLGLLATIAGGCACYAVIAWFAGRDPTAHTEPDVVRAPRAELAAVLIAYVGLAGVLNGQGVPFAVLFVAGVAGWGAISIRAGYRARDFAWLIRGWRPFTALLLAALVPKLLLLGPGWLAGLPVALPSGIFQQVGLQLGLLARLEAVLGRPDAAAVLAALLFGAAHTGMNVGYAGGDQLLALSSAMVLQAAIGLVFCLAYLRHRAAIALGVAHAIVIA